MSRTGVAVYAADEWVEFRSVPIAYAEVIDRYIKRGWQVLTGDDQKTKLINGTMYRVTVEKMEP